MSTLTLTLEQQNRITKTLEAMPVLRVGLGNATSACSIAAINLALNGKLTDSIPACMSKVIGKWIVRIQDKMPAEIRNSPRWRSLLPLAAGTGRQREQERFALIMNWVWDTVLPTLTPVAKEGGFGGEWAKMLKDRTPEAAAAAASIASTTHAYDYGYSFSAAASVAAYVFSYASYASASSAAASAASAASAALDAFDALDALGAADHYWTTIDPCAMLERLLL